ncbi:MAG: glycosyltransferase family 4 protein, partial [Phycisphaerae bacterium]
TNYFAAAAKTRFGLPAERVHVVPMGIRVDDIASAAAPEERSGDGRRSSAPARRDPRDNTPFTIGYLARICPEKGLANLCDALARLRASGRECRLRAAGYLGRGDRGYLDAIRKQLEAQGGGNDFEYVGEVDRAGKRGFLQSLDLFSVPTVYHEAKGLYILEALAAGVPVVQPRHGSFPELVESTGGGVLYDPCDANGLADAIAELMDDPPCRRALARCGQATVRESYTDTLMADRMWALYKRLCHCS